MARLCDSRPARKRRPSRVSPISRILVATWAMRSSSGVLDWPERGIKGGRGEGGPRAARGAGPTGGGGEYGSSKPRRSPEIADVTALPGTGPVDRGGGPAALRPLRRPAAARRDRPHRHDAA